MNSVLDGFQKVKKSRLHKININLHINDFGVPLE